MAEPSKALRRYGRNVRIQREPLMTREELSDATGIDLAIIRDIELARYSADVEMILKIAHALDHFASDFFDFDQGPRPEPSAPAFGKLIRKLRRERGVGQDQFAQEAGINRSHVSLIELGKRNVELETIVKLARGLELTPAELLRKLPRPERRGERLRRERKVREVLERPL
jgi:transcriptional regulator with XRE-family HTH domain